jgi:hypothetical protein
MFIEVFKKSEAKHFPLEELHGSDTKEYELRIVIRDVENVPLINTTSVNIKIKLVISKNGNEEIKETDVHNNSTNGIGQFNWRFVCPYKFPFKNSFKFQVFHVNMISKDEKISEKPIKFDKLFKQIHKNGKKIEDLKREVKMGI